jgi:hypothetical protein
MAHRHRPGADKALIAGPQRRALDRPASWIGPIQHPHLFAELGGLFEHIQERGDEGVDAATDILQIDQNDVKGRHHLPGRPAHLAIEAEHRHAMDGIGIIGRLDHIVLLVAAHAVLGAEGGAHAHIAERGDRIQRVGEIGSDRRRMGKQRHAPPGKGAAQGRVSEEAIKAGLKHGPALSRESHPARIRRHCGNPAAARDAPRRDS